MVGGGREWLVASLRTIYDLYIPPHVQKRTWKKPTEKAIKKTLRRAIHLPYLPILTWARQYTRDDLFADAIGGLTIAVMLIPQSMAYSLLSDLPPIMGMYTATISPILYTFLGTSKHLSVGPAALMSLFMPKAMANLLDDTNDRPSQRMALGPVLAFWVGVVYMICSTIRVSKLIRFLSHTVLMGFQTGASVYIGFSQLKYLFGITVPHFDYNYKMYHYIVNHRRDGDRDTQILGAVAFFFVYGLKVMKRDLLPPTPERKAQRWYKVFSWFVTFSTIIMVVLTALWAKYLLHQGKHIKIVGNLTPGWNPVKGPHLSEFDATKTFTEAIPLALIGFMEHFAMARKYALQNKYDIDINQEACSLGIINLLSSCFSAYPATGNFGRTALASDIGVKTQMANLAVGIVISVVLSSLTSILYYIPKATLGAIICNAVISLIDWPEFIKAFWIAPVYFAIMSFTFVVTALIDVAMGLEYGLIAAIIMLLFQVSNLQRTEMGRIDDGPTLYPRNEYPEAKPIPGVAVFKLNGYLFFGNSTKLRDEVYKFMSLSRRRTDGDITHLVLDLSGSSGLDLTTMLALSYLVSEGNKMGIKVQLAGVQPTVRSNLVACGLIDKVGGMGTVSKTVEDLVGMIIKDRDCEAGHALIPVKDLYSKHNKGGSLKAHVPSGAT